MRHISVLIIASLASISPLAAKGQASAPAKLNAPRVTQTGPAQAASVPESDKNSIGPFAVSAGPAPLSNQEQAVSLPPQVTLENDRLTIIVTNSRMGDVLNAVKQKTGAALEMPAFSEERVAGQFGPGAPRDVLSQLLNGSHYDYVLLGSPQNPDVLKKIVLIAKAASPPSINTVPETVDPQPKPVIQRNFPVDDEPDTELSGPGEQPALQQSSPEEAAPSNARLPDAN